MGILLLALTAGACVFGVIFVAILALVWVYNRI